MIKINKITPPTAHLYSPTGYVGEVNEYEFHDVLIQLKHNYVPGYYCLVGEDRVDLMPGGKISHQPEGFFDLYEKQLQEIMGF